jgi:hypothetical protein
MTGRYLHVTPLDSSHAKYCDVTERRFAATWSKFAGLCRSLDRDGLAFDVSFNLAGSRPHVLITASGTAKPRRSTVARVIALPSPVPAQRCRERAAEAAWFLPENAARRKTDTPYWRTHQARHAELFQMAEEHLRAEHEYWRELELISGQRQHFKPGLTAATAHADDEVAA